MFDSLRESGGLCVDCNNLIYVGYKLARKIRIFTPLGGKAMREIPCGIYNPWQISMMEPSKMLVVKTGSHHVKILDQQGKEKHMLSRGHFIYPVVCKNGAIYIAVVNKCRSTVSIEQYTNGLKYLKTLISIGMMDDEVDHWCFLREFTSGELALCFSNRLYIFQKIVSPPES